MTVNFPPSPSPYAGRSRPDDKTQTGAVHRSGVPDVVRAEAGGSLQPPDVQAGQPSQNLFRTGGQVPLDPPPAGPLNGTVSKGLGDKFQVIVGGADSASASTPSDVSRNQNFSFDAVLHLLLTVSVDEFKESQKQAQEDVEEKISELDASAQDLQTAAHERLLGAVAAGAGAIVSGTLGFVAAGANFGGALRANSAINATTGLGASDKAGEFSRLTSSTTAVSSTLQGTGQGLQGGMGILQGEDDAEAAGDDADKARADKAAADDDSLHETALGMKQEYLSVMQDFLDKEKGWEQSQDQTMMNLARNV
jgi:hypothetical protein